MFYLKIAIMDAIECILTRRCVRKFKNIPVEWDKIGKILEAGRAAPSAGNLQDWKFIVITDETIKKNIADSAFNQYWMMDAPIIIVIVSEPYKNERFYGLRGEKLYSVQDAAAAAQNMLIAAHALGLGACWIGAFDESKVKDILKMIPEARPQIILPIGYAAEIPPVPVKYKIENIAYFNKWHGRMKDINFTLGYTSAKVMGAIDKGKKILDKINQKIRKE